jgi:hypothetical protein
MVVFFYNQAEGGYGYSQSILDVGIANALETTDFNYQKFSNRFS